MTKKKCDCIFCNFKCPVCGAEEINITYSPVFTCSNNENNIITFKQDLKKLELNCQECGEWLNSENFEDRDKLENLIIALDNLQLDLSHSIECKYNEDDHSISINHDHSRWEITEIDKTERGD